MEFRLVDELPSCVPNVPPFQKKITVWPEHCHCAQSAMMLWFLFYYWSHDVVQTGLAHNNAIRNVPSKITSDRATGVDAILTELHKYDSSHSNITV